MTIALYVKVNDGIVLATDSASTLTTPNPGGNGDNIVNVYNNADKVFNLRKGSPIGAMTYGMGNIGVASIATLVKDFRVLLDDSTSPYHIDPANYTIQEVANKLRDFMLAEYLNAYTAGSFPTAETGFVIAGYSSGAPLSESITFSLQGGQATAATVANTQDQTGVIPYAQNEAIMRLIYGLPSQLPNVLRTNLGVDPAQIDPTLLVVAQACVVPLHTAAMPIQDAIDLAYFLVDLTIKYSRFAPSVATVGEPIEIAAITKHEQFKWIYRKHYYGTTLNPPN